MKAKSKLFVVRNFQADTSRLIRAQTQNQVEKFLEAEALKSFWKGTTAKVVTMDEVIALTAAGVKPEDIPEAV